MNGTYCDKHDAMAAEIHDIHECLLGSNSSANSDGLRARVNRHQVVISSIVRILWIMITAGIATVVGIVCKACAN